MSNSKVNLMRSVNPAGCMHMRLCSKKRHHLCSPHPYLPPTLLALLNSRDLPPPPTCESL